MKVRIALLSVIGLLIAAPVLADADGRGNQAVYEIRMFNETATQWFSPLLCAVHDRRVRLFNTGKAATTGLATFSEDGFNGVLAEELRENPQVFSVLESAPGLTPPGSVRIEQITGPANGRLTCAAMPVTTNDVLTAVQSVKLPRHPGITHFHNSTEWNLGSEVNNYSASSMPQDSVNLAPEGPGNPVTISDNVVFGAAGRPPGVPTLLSPFVRAYKNSSGEVIAEGTMSVFNNYVGSPDFPAEIYGWTGSASQFAVTRIQ